MYRHKQQGIRKNHMTATKHQLRRMERNIMRQIIDTGLIPDAHKVEVERRRSARVVK
jgi:hypothetical protein